MISKGQKIEAVAFKLSVPIKRKFFKLAEKEYMSASQLMRKIATEYVISKEKELTENWK